MVLQKSRPDENVGDFDGLGHAFSVGFARTDSAQDAVAMSDGARSDRGRGLVSDRIKHISKTRSCLSDLVDYLGVPIVEYFLRSVRLYKVVVLWAASRDDL